jgi:hydroxymethylbilane synthase
LTPVPSIRLATRKSPLALWQAHYVKRRLQDAHPDLNVEILGMTTEGDLRTGTRLASIGGKGLFMKELEQALLAGDADIAVHSMKDVTVDLPGGLVIAAALARGDPRDALVSNKFNSLENLPDGSRVGTSSLRRRCQLKYAFPSLKFVDLRGNVNTRLARLDEGAFDAIVLAAAGLIRLEMRQRIAGLIPEEQCLPAVGQGTIGVECRADDTGTISLLQSLADENTTRCLAAERSLNEALDGGCHVPVAGYALLEGDDLYLRGRVGDPNGERLLLAQARGIASEPTLLGETVAADLIAQGADAILKAVVTPG